MRRETGAWVSLVLAGLLEIVWATTMKLSDGFTELVPTILTVVLLALSFGLLAKAFRVLPTGTGYAVFTGIGAVGTVLVGAFFFEEALNGWKWLFITTLLIGIIGLKQVTGSDAE